MNRTVAIVIAIVLAASLYVLGNARVSLWDRDEPRYAQTSRQMLREGDWVVPRFLDKVRTAKPVFIYWCQAGAMALIGDEGPDGVFAARLPSVVTMTGVLIVLAVVVSRGAGRERAFWTVFVMATCALTIWSAKACTTDAVLLVGTSVAQLCLYAIWRGRATWPVVSILAVAVGQAALTKGPVVLGVMGMTLLALGAFRLIDKVAAKRRETRGFPIIPSPGTPGAGGGEGQLDVGRWTLDVRPSNECERPTSNVQRPTSNVEDPHPDPLPAYREREKPRAVIAKAIVALLIVAALVAPWLYLVQQREKAFLSTSVSHDVFTRIVKPLEGHSGPPGYHLALIFATFFPWSLLLPMAIVSGWKNRADPQIRFALAAVIGPWVMFELVVTKLPHYMLPTFPAIAFLTADAIVRCLQGKQNDLHAAPFRIAACVFAIVAIALSLGPVSLAHQFGQPLPAAVSVACLTGAIAVLFVGHVLTFRPRAALLTLGVGMALVCGTLFAFYLPRADALRTSIRVADILHAQGATQPGDVVMLDYKEPSLAFYQGGTIRERSWMALSHDRLDAGPRWFVITDEVWAKTPPEVQARLKSVGSVRGLAYADGGRTVSVRVLVRER